MTADVPQLPFGVRSRSASPMPPRNGRGAGPSVRVFYRVIACEAGRLAVDCRRDTVALFQVKAGGLDAERRQRDPTTAASTTLFFRHLHRVGAANNVAQRPISLQAWAMGYFAKISSTRLNAFSAAASGVMPLWMMSIQPCIQTCSF
jgi:hypothetical protein